MRALAIGVGRPKNNKSRNLENNHDSDLNTATSAHQRPPRPPLRPPLQTRDQNAIMRQHAPLTAKSGNANNMPPYDKQDAGRPLMPSISAAAKTSNRTPLTPRVAGSALPTSTTPLSRRTTRSDNGTPPISLREEIATPVSTFLNNNITPRSGSRKSRVDSTNTTPIGTPNGTPIPPSTNGSSRGAQDLPNHGSGLAIAGMNKDVPKRSTVSFSPATSDAGYPRSPVVSNSGDSKFFFASDAKSVVPPSRPQLPTKSSSTFFYANGELISPPPQSSGASAAGSVMGEEKTPSKFFHANGTPDLQSSHSPYFPQPRANSTVSTSSRMTSPRLTSPGTLSPPQRPTSPSKLNQHAIVSSLGGAPNLPPPILSRPQQGGRGQSSSAIATQRKTSIESVQRRISHGRSASAEPPDFKTVSRRVSSSSSFEGSASAALLETSVMSVPVSTPEEIPEEIEASTDASSELPSSVKAGHLIEHMNELAANARRERKVLDLEITNSSLAAINRTLEREMRKQTAELRRYRRLSRSGRLSIATSVSLRSSSGGRPIIEGVEGTELSDMSEEESEEGSEYDSSEESIDDGSLSPAAMAESDLRHRKRDEKRLQLDLSKHQQLLIDSQKMNQSLKRCLGWTEEMINEGKRALEYTVRVSDVELGGRVLAPDELDEGETEGMNDVGATLLKPARIAAASETTVWGGEGRDDRDSGIDLNGLPQEPILHSQLPS